MIARMTARMSYEGMAWGLASLARVDAEIAAALVGVPSTPIPWPGSLHGCVIVKTMVVRCETGPMGRRPAMLPYRMRLADRDVVCSSDHAVVGHGPFMQRFRDWGQGDGHSDD
jgi:hypothetical protein